MMEEQNIEVGVGARSTSIVLNVAVSPRVSVTSCKREAGGESG